MDERARIPVVDRQGPELLYGYIGRNAQAIGVRSLQRLTLQIPQAQEMKRHFARLRERRIGDDRPEPADLGARVTGCV